MGQDRVLVLVSFAWQARQGWIACIHTKFLVLRARSFTVASLCAPVYSVRKDSLSFSDPQCYYCFYLCLLDGALRCGTL